MTCSSGRHTAAAVLLFLLAAGCGEDKKLSIAVEFPDDQARAATYAVRVMVIVPSQRASCQALLDGTDAPDDVGYPIEDQIDVILPDDKGSRPLDLGDPGIRLFYAQARDADSLVILHGCEQESASLSGPSEVLIQLQWVTIECSNDAECDDGEHCTQNLCDPDTSRCVFPPVTTPPGQEGPYRDPTCADAVDNDCDGLTDTDDTECWACNQDSDCDDSNVCTENRCVQNACTNPPVADGTNCDDGNYCTATDTCTGGLCSGTGSPCTQECLTVCDEDADSCNPSPAGTPCTDDGLYCTGDETCDGAGACGSSGDPCSGGSCSTCREDTDTCSPDDAFCDNQTPGSVCLPDCASDASGCVLPPGSLSLACAAPSGGEAACSIALTGASAAGQDDCLACSASAGVAILDFTDFDDGGGLCNADGWQLVPGTGQLCRDKADNCSLSGGPRACCDDFNTVCDPAAFGSPVLKSNFVTNCGGGFKQWRIQKTFDLSNVSAPWVCFDAADRGASATSVLMLYAEDPTNAFEQVFCYTGGPQEGVDDFFYNQCVDLPAWAAGSASVTVTFIMHSDQSGEYLFLDNIALKGWVGGCLPAIATALDESFAACDTSAWTFSGGTDTCNPTGCTNQPTWAPGIFGNGAPFFMDTTVDASALDTEITACIRLGGVAPAAGDRITLRYDAGAGFQTAWAQDAPLGIDGECREICVNLSDLDPAVNNHSALGLRIGINSAGAIGVFGVRVTGARSCPLDDTVISFSPFAGDGSGNYDFTATSVTGASLDTTITCQWNQDPALTGSDTVNF